MRTAQEFGKEGVISLYLQCSPYERALRYLEREVSPEAGFHAEVHLPKQPYSSLEAVAAEMVHLDLPEIRGITETFLGNANRDEDDATRYKEIYGFDYRDEALYDDVINVDERDRDVNFAKVVSSLQMLSYKTEAGTSVWFGE